MRTKNTVFNLSANIITMLVTNILSFISRTIFIQILDASYLGINGLYSNVLSMLSLAELGIGTAIVYSLYKPLADGDTDKISALMSFYKKAYRIIGLVIFGVGIILLFFLKYFVNGIEEIEHYQLYYILFLFNTASTYFLAYKEILVSTDQKGYLLTSRNLFFQVITSISQLVVLVISKDYAFYLITQIGVLTIRKIFINRYVSKLYSQIDFNSKIKIGEEDFQEIVKNVKAMICQKIGGYVVYGTDNLLIGYFASVTMVGLYSNYSMIVTIVYNCVVMFFSAMGASVGNVAAENKTLEYKIYKTTYFVNFCLSSFTAICLYTFFNPFIRLWIGESFLLPDAVVGVVCMNYYITAMRKSTEVFYNANGLFWYGRYKSIFEAGVNFIISVILGMHYGMLGIFMGTTVSLITMSVLFDVYILYKYGFKKNYKLFIKDYLIKYIFYLVFTVLFAFGGKVLVDYWNINTLISIVITAIVYFIIFFGIVFIFWGKTEQYQDLLKRLNEIAFVKHIKSFVGK